MTEHGIKNICRYLRAKSSPAATLIVLIIAIGSINAWQLVLPNFAYDNSFGIAAAKNIYDGNGYALTNMSQDDLSVTRFEPLNKWPPGYSYLLVFVKRVTHADWIISCYILNALGCTLLILALRKIFLLLLIPTRISNIYLLFAGLIPYPFLSLWFSDILAIACFMWAMALLLQMIVKNRNLLPCSITAGLLLSFCAWLKYLYLPISFVPFIFLLLYTRRINHVNLGNALLKGAVFLLFSILGLLWFQQGHSGQAVYINPTGRGFFPESLLHVGPVVPASLIDFRFFNMQLSPVLNIPYLKMIIFWKWLNALLLFAILYLIFRHFKKNGFHLKQPLMIYMTMALLVSVAICVFLIFLSLTQGPFMNRYTAYWTYVQELRYYAPVLIFIPQGILFLMLYSTGVVSRMKKIAATAILFIVAIHITHGMYYLPKQILIKKETGKKRPSEQLDLLAFKTTDELLKHDKKLVVSSNDHEIANIAGLAGAPVMYNFDSLNNELHSSKPLTLLVVLNEPVLPDFNRFFSLNHPELLFTFKSADGVGRDTEFYIVKFR